jgi:cytochrome P450
MEDFAAEMPVVVFLSLMGLPLAHRQQLRALAHRILDPSGDTNRSVPLGELLQYLRPQIEQRTRDPGPDAFSQILIKAGEQGLDPDEVIKLVATVLLGGLDTVSSALTYMARYLADNPRDCQRILAERAVLRPAIEEIFRRYPVSITGRQVMQDTAFRGVALKKDDHIVWSVGMYNFDERVFPNPLSVDFDRKRTPHDTFGQGVHICPGAYLARTEMYIFAETWLSRIPEFHIPPGTTVGFRDGQTISYRALPLRVGPGAPQA